MIVWAWPHLEADFQRFYGIDLQQDGLGGRMTWRRFRTLMRGLPKDGATARFLADRSNRNLIDTGLSGLVT